MNFNTLIWKEPWLAPIALNITAVIKTNEINTAGITPNGKTLYYNPDFWKRLRSEERLGVQLHELLHIVNLHAKRRDGRDFSKWNTACDMSINYQIKKAGYKLPASALPGEDESAEQIYDMLNTAKSPTSRNGLLSGNGQPGSGANILADDLLKRNCDGSESFSEETAEAAESAGKLAGRGSTPLSKLYQPIASKADWRTVLRGFVKSISGYEVDYLSYEFDEYGICEDILCCKPKSKLCVLTDESGSIEDGLYRQFLGELNKMSRFAEVFVSGFTDGTKLDAVPLKDYRRTMTGGTDLLPAYREACEKDFDGIIVLTDGYLEFPDSEPKPTVWAMPERRNRKYEVIL